MFHFQAIFLSGRDESSGVKGSGCARRVGISKSSLENVLHKKKVLCLMWGGT